MFTFLATCKRFHIHSPCQILVQVMESSRGFPLTPGRWVHMWLKFDEIEMFCPQYLTNKFSKTKIAPLGSHLNTIILNLLVSTMMQYDILGIKNKLSYLEAIFNPENSQKMPKNAILGFLLDFTIFWIIWAHLWSTFEWKIPWLRNLLFSVDRNVKCM